MSLYKKIIVVLVVCFIFACSKNTEPVSPARTLKAYHIAIKKKDIAMLKQLLSKDSLQLHNDQAQAQNTSTDEIILRETLFPAEQRVFNFRNEIIEGDKATVEVQNDFGSWDMIYFVKEGGLWKIDKKGTSEQILEDSEEADQKLDEQIRKSREMDEIDSIDSDPNQSPEPIQSETPINQPDEPNNTEPDQNAEPKSIDSPAE